MLKRHVKEAEKGGDDRAEHRQLQQLSNEHLSKELCRLDYQEMFDLKNIKSPPVFGGDDPEQYEEALDATRLCLARVKAEMRGRGLLPNYEAAQVIIGG